MTESTLKLATTLINLAQVMIEGGVKMINIAFSLIDTKTKNKE